jgi:hypothetical protein
VKQQNWEKEKIDQTFHLLPHGAVQGGEAADQIAAQNQGKIGEEELGKVHLTRIADLSGGPSGVLSPGVHAFLRVLWVFPLTTGARFCLSCALF